MELSIALPAATPAPSAPVEGRVFEAISRSEGFAAAIHEAVLAEKPVLEIKDFALWYGAKQALFSISFPVAAGKVTALIGPSGCGKSTLLRSVNRLNDLIDSVRVSGDMLLNGDPIYGPGVDAIELRKRIGMVFQKPNPFPMSTFENVVYSLRIDGVRIEGEMRLNGDSIYGRAVDVIDLRKRVGMVFQKPNPFPMSIFENVVYSLRIDGERNRGVLDEVCERSLRGAGLWEEVKDRLSASALALSGGQQQRLCIARAISADPEVLLLDEPCSALDPIATGRIEDLIEELKGAYSVLIVTHNMQQASRTSDYTAFMYLGRMIEYGPTADIFRIPRLRETEDYVTGRFG